MPGSRDRPRGIRTVCMGATRRRRHQAQKGPMMTEEQKAELKTLMADNRQIDRKSGGPPAEG